MLQVEDSFPLADVPQLYSVVIPASEPRGAADRAAGGGPDVVSMSVKARDLLSLHHVPPANLQHHKGRGSGMMRSF